MLSGHMTFALANYLLYVIAQQLLAVGTAVQQHQSGSSRPCTAPLLLWTGCRSIPQSSPAASPADMHTHRFDMLNHKHQRSQEAAM